MLGNGTQSVLLVTVSGARLVRGRCLPLSHQEQNEVHYLIRARREVEAIRRIRDWRHASLADALATLQTLR